MKKQNLTGLGALTLAGLVLTACGGLGKMEKKIGDVKFEVTPDPVEAKGDSVNIEISAKIPAKYFAKKVVLEATPVIVTEDGKEFAFETDTYQGEKATGNGTVVNFKEGATLTYTDKIAADMAMEVAEVKVKFHGTQGKKEGDFTTPEKIADGTILTPYLVANDDMLSIAAHGFVQITEEIEEADIHFLVNSSGVRHPELKKEDVKMLDEFIFGHHAHERIAFKKMLIEAYASPEGEFAINENLAKERAEAAQKALTKIFAKHKAQIDTIPNFFEQNPKDEDWEGFRTLVEKSEIKDKDLIIRVLNEYKDNAEKEKRIKDMSETYKELKNDILPELRRSEVFLVYDKIGYYDEELRDLAFSNPDTLNEKELLYAATLFEGDLDKQEQILKSAEAKFPENYAVLNNLGAVYYAKADLATAKAYYEKAAAIDENGKEALNNLGVIARVNGDRKAATDLFNKAANTESTYNLGIIAIQNGDYDAAVSKTGDNKTFNAALANLLAGNANKAIEIIDASNEKETAMGYYLKAIAGARSNNLDVVTANLKSAVAKDSALREKASRDAEFISFRENEAFKAVVQ